MGDIKIYKAIGNAHHLKDKMKQINEVTDDPSLLLKHNVNASKVKTIDDPD